MAKYTMHDYEKEMREEERQTELQKALEAELAYESRYAEDNWHEWQKQQKIAEDEDDDFLLYDWGLEDDFDELLFEDDDLAADELYQEMCEPEISAEELRISRKAIARNRHLGTERAKRRAEQSARILERRCQNLDANATPYEQYRTYARAAHASKKAERTKTA